MVSYVNINKDEVRDEDLPVSFRKKGVVPLSHSSRSVAGTEENLALYGGNVVEDDEDVAKTEEYVRTVYVRAVYGLRCIRTHRIQMPKFAILLKCNC